MKLEFVIGAELRPDDDEPLYWSNDDGWVDLSSATVFTADEAEAPVYLPLGASGFIRLPRKGA